MEQEDLKVGDVVYLKSGSPKMTIVTIEARGWIGDRKLANTLWFVDYMSTVHSGRFSLEALTKEAPVVKGKSKA
jgi:uncharacterized protein YodC (DUF2158 family)